MVESLCWAEPRQLLMCASKVEDEGEASDAFMLHLTWQGGDAPQGDDAKLSTFTPAMIEVRDRGDARAARMHAGTCTHKRRASSRQHSHVMLRTPCAI